MRNTPPPHPALRDGVVPAEALRDGAVPGGALRDGVVPAEALRDGAGPAPVRSPAPRGRGGPPPGAPSIGYLGWCGHQNLGDDVLLEVIAGALPGARLVPQPMDLRHLGAALAGREWVGRGGRPLVLGGGTAVGRANWRAALRAARLFCGAEYHLIGVGVEDPRFSGRNSFSGRDELRRWRRALSRFERITVRGPRSAALLAEVGIAAEVVGDPALLLCPGPRPTGALALRRPTRYPTRADALAVNLGFGDDLWGHDHDLVVELVTEVALDAVSRGREVVAVVVNPDDAGYARRVLARLPDGAGRMVVARTSAQFFAALDGCAVMLAERLHAGVLAVAAGVPTVLLEYQPKCRDFMESVGLDRYCVRTDQATSGLVTMLVDEAVDDPELGRRTAAAVADLRGRLRREVDRLVENVRTRFDGEA